MRKEKLAVLGGSRGLGFEISKGLLQQGFEVFVASRTAPVESHGNLTWKSFDFSQEEQGPALVSNLEEFGASTIIYCAGGGPYGLFGEKKWKDHNWALNVSFKFPAFLLWSWCHGGQLNSVEKFVVMGSSVAENQPDPKAAMYCASKHALRGLITSLKQEYPQKNIELFSPPYMDTQLLPPGAWPRQQKGLVHQPAAIATDFLQTLLR
jgi:short-subunit dehydrogenase